MDGDPRERSSLFEVFLKSTQYLVRLKQQQDIWSHVGNLVVKHFPADWVAFAERDAGGRIVIHHWTPADASLTWGARLEGISALAVDVLESGFLISKVVSGATAAAVALLPIVQEYRTRAVMVVGSGSTTPISSDLLNVYLAVSGLVGTTLERLESEQELSRHRTYLEDLVKERTLELIEAKRQNELILDSVGEGILGLNLEGRITFANPFAARILGREQPELIGADAHLLLHPDCPLPALPTVAGCVLQAGLRSRSAHQVGEDRFVRRDGCSFPVDFTTTPIISASGNIGVVLVFRDVTRRRRAEDERERLLVKEQDLAAELAALNEELLGQNEELRAAHEETARLLEERESLFQQLQESLVHIPQEPPGVRLGHAYRSGTQEARIGGDFYDVFEAKDGRIGLLIGDVSGSGVEAARIATLVKDTVHAFAHQFRHPHLVLRQTNQVLLERNVPGFVTAFLGFLDAGSGSLAYSSAGHPPPLLLTGGQVELLESAGVPLGVVADARYHDRLVDTPADSLFLLYTDGITEARSGGDFFGELRLMSAFRRLSGLPVDRLPSLLLDEAVLFTSGRLQDDAALLAIRHVRESAADQAEQQPNGTPG